MRDRRKKSFSWLVIALLGSVFVVNSMQTNQLLAQQIKLSDDLINLEYLSASTQRLSRMIIGESNDPRVVYYIDEQTAKYLHNDSENRLYVVDFPHIREAANEVLKSWDTLSQLFKLLEEDATVDEDSITLAADNHFNSMTDLTVFIGEEKSLLEEEIEQSRMTGYGILALIAFCVLNDFICTSFSLKRSKELAQLASLDGGTGLFNRSTCQDILKDANISSPEKQFAVVVIDLNDLKITNDLQGHRVGDELISTFARILREATQIHTEPPFLGRYGGDEFVVYYETLDSYEELEKFVAKLDTLVTVYNQNDERKFKISYAEGHAFHKSGTDGISPRGLFEEADEQMYENKRVMKQTLVEQNETS